MPNLCAILALGRQAHDQCLKTLGLAPLSRWPFAHGACHNLDDGRLLTDSYHCSRYNTQTRRLTEEMFRSVLAAIRQHLDGGVANGRSASDAQKGEA